MAFVAQTTSLTFFLLIDVLIFGVGNMDGDLGLVGGRPLEEQPEGDVVAVRRELPEQRGPVFVGRDSNCDRLAVADLRVNQQPCESKVLWCAPRKFHFKSAAC